MPNENLPDPTPRFCINCDNRHGCRTPRPRCLTLARDAAERRASGRQLMARRGLLPLCASCDLFRQCWTAEAYRGTLRRGLPPDLAP